MRVIEPTESRLDARPGACSSIPVFQEIVERDAPDFVAANIGTPIDDDFEVRISLHDDADIMARMIGEELPERPVHLLVVGVGWIARLTDMKTPDSAVAKYRFSQP
jgi:hypothetical protein